MYIMPSLPSAILSFLSVSLNALSQQKTTGATRFQGLIFRTNRFITAGHVAFFAFIAELKDPKDYPKSLVLLQGTDTSLYLITAIVIYCYAGQDVTSPALGSAGPVVAKVAYGIALPTVCLLS